MIHLIYIYLIISAAVLGYNFGDPFQKKGALIVLSLGLLWLPVSLYSLGKFLLIKLCEKDLVQITKIYFGINIYKNNENVEEMINSLDKYMVPKWQKMGLYGKYCLGGFRKLQRMNKAKAAKDGDKE